MSAPPPRRLRNLRLCLLLVWAVSSFGFSWFARDLERVVAGWPFNFWFAAQGAVLVFLAVAGIYAVVMNRHERPQREGESEDER